MAAPDPADLTAYADELARVTIGPLERLSDRIELCDSDPSWPLLYEREGARVRRVLGRRVIRLEHVGSTSVPGLVAKPIIDMALEVRDSSDEPAYVPDLEAAGYVLRLRTPEWLEHRMFRGPDVAVNLHVFSAGCPETEVMVRFRDRLREDAQDRELYARVKRQLASRDWTYMQQYADAKTDIVKSIMSRTTSPSRHDRRDADM